MRLSIVLASATAFGLSAVPAARACDPVATACLPRAVVFPAYTPEGLRVGTVEARIRRPVRLERSPFTGQPITVVYNDPGRLPGSIDPYVTLVPLPRAPHFHTKAVYPRGY